MFMFIIANLVGSTIQITTLPLPVLSTLQASGLVFNTICATILLGEPFTKSSLGGTVLVAGGALLIAMFGALPEPSHSLDQLLVLLNRQQFLAWMICTFIVMGLILVSAWYVARISRKRHGHTYEHLSPRARQYVGMAFGCVSAILSAHSLLVAKSAVELLVRTIADHHNQFNRFQSWLILVALVFFALTQLYFLHKGLRLVSTSVLYPLVFCVYNIIAILDGLIYFKQTDRLPPLHAGLISLGTVILLAGVLALSWRLSEESDSTAPPPDAHTLLTPGMGLVEDTTTEDEADTATASATPAGSDVDDEAVTEGVERTPLLKTPRSQDSWRLFSLRGRRSTEQDRSEILDALEDRTFTSRSRKVSRRASTSTAEPRASSTASSDGDEENSDDDDSPSRFRQRAPRRAHTLGGLKDVADVAKESSRRHQRQHARRVSSVFDHSSPSLGRVRDRRDRRTGSIAGYLQNLWRSTWRGSGDGSRPSGNEARRYGTL